MTLEQLLSTTFSSSQTSCSQIPNQMITTSKTRSCQVCGNPARFVNYGALTCQSCRAFFRRHGHRSKVRKLENYLSK
jgi:ribosomal protein S14